MGAGLAAALLLAAGAARGQALVPVRGAQAAQTVSCDDLDPPSLIRAIEAELPAMLQRTEPTLRIGRRRLSLRDYARTTLRPLLDPAALAKGGIHGKPGGGGG